MDTDTRCGSRRNRRENRLREDTPRRTLEPVPLDKILTTGNQPRSTFYQESQVRDFEAQAKVALKMAAGRLADAARRSANMDHAAEPIRVWRGGNPADDGARADAANGQFVQQIVYPVRSHADAQAARGLRVEQHVA